MSHQTKVILACLPFILLGVFALLHPKYEEWHEAKTLTQLETLPLKSDFSVTAEEAHGTRHTYAIGNYGITDVGNLRLAFVDMAFSGSSSGSITLATKSEHSGGGGSTGSGNRRFTVNHIPHGSRCTFAGTTFEFINGKLIYGEQSIDALGPPQLILIGPHKKIIEIKPLKTHSVENTNTESNTVSLSP
ncbi:hypothetical protein Rhal01_02585 [Rubritalea halochordaticola]|uniref:LPS export ABC transporter periplasmic protein LptC n=1 Tax=Rubritalea halochordaticola TaxID=714537 RepID=A0ABP9V704_9BACT